MIFFGPTDRSTDRLTDTVSLEATTRRLKTKIDEESIFGQSKPGSVIAYSLHTMRNVGHKCYSFSVTTVQAPSIAGPVLFTQMAQKPISINTGY